MNITIGGYYGFGNLGDEETLRLLARDIKNEYPDAKIKVLSRTDYSFAKTINRNSPGEIKKALGEADVFILGGGTLIQDTTSIRSLFYYCELIKLAHRMGCKVMMLGCGIGPLKHTKYAAEALELCSYISVRDKYSSNLLTEMGISHTISADRVLSREPLSYSGRGRYFTVSLRKCRTGASLDLEALYDGLYPYINSGLLPIYVSMQDSFDREICEAAAKITGGRVISPRGFDELLQLQRGAKFAVGMRLHYLISAALAGCPALSLEYDPKCRALDFPSCSATRLVPHVITEKIEALTPAKIPTNAADLCRDDILAIGKKSARAVENRRQCLK